jgi:hypothetical protein
MRVLEIGKRHLELRRLSFEAVCLFQLSLCVAELAPKRVELLWAKPTRRHGWGAHDEQKLKRKNAWPLRSSEPTDIRLESKTRSKKKTKKKTNTGNVDTMFRRTWLGHEVTLPSYCNFKTATLADVDPLPLLPLLAALRSVWSTGADQEDTLSHTHTQTHTHNIRRDDWNAFCNKLSNHPIPHTAYDFHSILTLSAHPPDTPLRLLFCNCCFLSISDANVSRERCEAFWATDVSPCTSPSTGVPTAAAWTGVVWTGVTLTSLVLAATGVVAAGTWASTAAWPSGMGATVGAPLSTEIEVAAAIATGDEERRGDRVMGTVKGDTSRSISSAVNSFEAELVLVGAGTGAEEEAGVAVCGGISGSSAPAMGRTGTAAVAGNAVVVANWPKRRGGKRDTAAAVALLVATAVTAVGMAVTVVVGATEAGDGVTTGSDNRGAIAEAAAGTAATVVCVK